MFKNTDAEVILQIKRYFWNKTFMTHILYIKVWAGVNRVSYNF